MIVYVVFGTTDETESEWLNNIFTEEDKAKCMVKHLAETEDPSVQWRYEVWDTNRPLNIIGDTVEELMSRTTKRGRMSFLNVTKEQYTKARKIVDQFNEQRREVEEIKHRKEIKKLNGKCYKFKNSFGSGDSWWLYSKVVGIENDCMIVERIQKDCNGRLSIERGNEYIPDIVGKNTPISNEEYEKGVIELLNELRMTDFLKGET